MKKSLSVKLSPLPLILAMGIVLIVFSDSAKEGVSKGLEICVQTLIPSLFPFLCLSSAAVQLAGRKSGIFSKLFSILFHLPECAAAVFLFSLIGGYPVGPIMCSELFESGKIGSDEAKRMTLFCCSSGPAFCVIAVGNSLCGSRNIGLMLLASNILSITLIGLFLAFLDRKKPLSKAEILYKNKSDFSSVFTIAVEKSVNSIINICAYVIVFNVLLNLIFKLPLNGRIKDIIFLFSEVTTGCEHFKDKPSLLSFILGFGGICVFMQIKKHLDKVGAKSFVFLSVRLVNAGLSLAFFRLLCLIFPNSVQTLAQGMSVKAVSYSAPLSAALLFCFAVFILDNKKQRLFDSKW